VSVALIAQQHSYHPLERITPQTLTYLQLSRGLVRAADRLCCCLTYPSSSSRVSTAASRNGNLIGHPIPYADRTPARGE